MATVMRWDIAQMVSNTDPGWIKKRLEEMLSEAQRAKEKYYGKILSYDATEILNLFEYRDRFTLEYEGVIDYCSLRYSADSTDPVSKELFDAMRNATSKTGQILAFVELELGKLLENKPQLVNDQILREYQHYLEKILIKTPYMMDEPEEKLTIAKDKNGISSWSQLQGDWLSTRMFKVTIEGEEKTMPYGEIISLYQSPNRDLRRESNRIVYEGLGRDDLVWSSALRSICSDHNTMCELRRYPTPLTQSLISNDVESGAIDALMDTISSSVGEYQRYLNLKAKIMKIPKLGNWDIVAPLPDAPDRTYSWDESRDLVVSAYRSFDQQFGDWVDEMYRHRHIDGEVRRGKRSGAFCSTWLTGKSAWILQSFNGRIGDVYTQAHELGHAVHAYLGSRHQRPSNYEIGSCIAECGSVFGELLLTDHLLGVVKTNAEKQAILCTVLDEFGMAAFQVSARFWFEKSLYNAIKEGKYLDGETISFLWTSSRNKIYGESVEWLQEMRWEWTMKPHYYIPNYRFYNYPYVFAQLFVFALYKLYKEQGKLFVPKMNQLLSAGSSKSPSTLAREIGFDISQRNFWEKGIDQFTKFLEQVEATLD